jgi:hypothetical protein
MLCELNLETGLDLLGAPNDVRDYLAKGGIVVMPCPHCGDGHLLTIRQRGGQFIVATVEASKPCLMEWKKAG